MRIKGRLSPLICSSLVLAAGCGKPEVLKDDNRYLNSVRFVCDVNLYFFEKEKCISNILISEGRVKVTGEFMNSNIQKWNDKMFSYKGFVSLKEEWEMQYLNSIRIWCGVDVKSYSKCEMNKQKELLKKFEDKLLGMDRLDESEMEYWYVLVGYMYVLKLYLDID